MSENESQLTEEEYAMLLSECKALGSVEKNGDKASTATVITDAETFLSIGKKLQITSFLAPLLEQLSYPTDGSKAERRVFLGQFNLLAFNLFKEAINHGLLEESLNVVEAYFHVLDKPLALLALVYPVRLTLSQAFPNFFQKLQELKLQIGTEHTPEQQKEEWCALLEFVKTARLQINFDSTLSILDPSVAKALLLKFDPRVVSTVVRLFTFTETDDGSFPTEEFDNAIQKILKLESKEKSASKRMDELYNIIVTHFSREGASERVEEVSVAKEIGKTIIACYQNKSYSRPKLVLHKDAERVYPNLKKQNTSSFELLERIVDIQLASKIKKQDK